MARDLYTSRGLSGGTLRTIARATRSLCDLSDNDDFDIIKFLEVDLVKIIPSFHLFIEDDLVMGETQAFVANDSTAIVVSESVYRDACAGYFYARKILAHEFGHILLHHDMNRETKHFSRGRYAREIEKMELYHSAEWQADTFSILLILPHSYLKKNVTDTDLTERYNVSKRQATFVANRLNGIRKRLSTLDRSAAQKIIEAFQNRFQILKKSTSPGEDQLSLFA